MKITPQISPLRYQRNFARKIIGNELPLAQKKIHNLANRKQERK